MRTTIGFGIGLAVACLALAVHAAPQPPTHRAVAHKTTTHKAAHRIAPHRAAAHRTAKGPPSCAAISYRSLPAGAGDGEQQAGIYRSRFVTLTLRAEVKGGQAANYYVMAGDKRLTGDAGTVPQALAHCAVAKKLPPPGNAHTACTGERFRVLIAHSGKERLAALYALDSNTWHFCNAGSF